MIYKIFAISLLLSSCATIKAPDNFKYQEFQTSFFKIASWQKITSPQAPYKIYIEGDGHAFNSRGQITQDPTPHGILMRELAFTDPHENIIYLVPELVYITGMENDRNSRGRRQDIISKTKSNPQQRFNEINKFIYIFF